MHLHLPKSVAGSAGTKTLPTRQSASSRLQIELSPPEVAASLRHCHGLVFLDSARAQAGSISIVAAEPEKVLHKLSFVDLEQEIEQRKCVTPDQRHPQGAAIGWITYEGELCFGFYDHLLIFDHTSQEWSGSEILASKIRKNGVPKSGGKLIFSSSVEGEKYCSQVVRAKEYITAGDVYQLNITYPFEARWNGDGFALFESLRHYSPAPYSSYLNLGGQEIISSSPELFLRMSGRHITTRPIKGTRPRFEDQARDELSANELLTSPKEISELVMITDLERNDLGKICEYGQVWVSELLKLERYEQIFHLASTVEGELRAEVSHVSALESCFPGGSITGAPKKRAREIITEIENRKRGIYTGAIGYFGYNGESQFSVAIRTICKEDNQVSFSVGAGIVADSNPKQEYQETLDKAAGILLAAERLSSESN